MTFRLEIDIAFNVRPKKGERRAKDGTGRMVKASIYLGTEAECFADARAARVAAEKDCPGYSEVIAVRGYDRATFDAWVRAGGDQPKPTHTAETL